MKRLFALPLGLACLGLVLSSTSALAESATAQMHKITSTGSGIEAAVGTATFTDDDGGVTIVTDLQGLKPGQHGFHIHEKGSCIPSVTNGKIVAGGAAGGHYDPENTGKHLGPGGGGHMGDLPVLEVQPDGSSRVTLRVEGLTVSEIKNRAVIIHEGGDTYSDIPLALGGGEGRIACGVIK